MTVILQHLKKMAIDNRGYKAYNSMILKNKIILNYNSTSF